MYAFNADEMSMSLAKTCWDWRKEGFGKGEPSTEGVWHFLRLLSGIVNERVEGLAEGLNSEAKALRDAGVLPSGSPDHH